jgi:two-component system NtrC family sensor kinase
MKIIEFNPDGKPTRIKPGAHRPEEAAKHEILVEILPLLFHKLKNKLTPILGYTQILLARAGDDFSRERLAKIERNTSELSESLNTLKDYFKVAPAPWRPADINSILKGLAGEWQRISREAGARVVLELAPGLPRLPLDAGRMRLLLLAMADNAANALKAKTGPAGEIRISTHRQGGSLKLVVRDNGCGIREEEMASIWTPFYSTFPDHAGLGLVICERILADHGAACSVSSRAGEFSQFEMSFPLAAPADRKQDKGGGADARFPE